MLSPGASQSLEIGLEQPALKQPLVVACPPPAVLIRIASCRGPSELGLLSSATAGFARASAELHQLLAIAEVSRLEEDLQIRALAGFLHIAPCYQGRL